MPDDRETASRTMSATACHNAISHAGKYLTVDSVEEVANLPG